MSAHPNSRALFQGGSWPAPGIHQFQSADDCLAFMFGPADQDAHVKAWRRHQWLAAQLAAYDAANRRVQQHVNVMIARERAR